MCTIDVTFGKAFSVYFSSHAMCTSDFPKIESVHSQNYYIAFQSPYGPITAESGRACFTRALECVHSSNFTIDYVAQSTDCPSREAIDVVHCNNFTINYQARESCNVDLTSLHTKRIAVVHSSDFVITYEGYRNLSCQDERAVSAVHSRRFAVIFSIAPVSCSPTTQPTSTRLIKQSCLQKTTGSSSTQRCRGHPQIDLSFPKIYHLSVLEGICPRDTFLRTTATFVSNFEVLYYLNGSSPPPRRDECRTGGHSCTTNQTCQDLIDGYHCSCKDGFHPVSSNICLQVPCPRLAEPWIGEVKVIKSSDYVQNAFYSCPPGFKLVGSGIRSCTLGKWEGRVPLCVLYNLEQVLAVD